MNYAFLFIYAHVYIYIYIYIYKYINIVIALKSIIDQIYNIIKKTGWVAFKLTFLINNYVTKLY